MNKHFTNNIINLKDNVDYQDKSMVKTTEDELDKLISVALKKEIAYIHNRSQLAHSS